MSDRPEGLAMTGHEVLDDQHQHIGTVSDVIYDEFGAARWAVVDPGVMRAEHYVPVEGASFTPEGAVVVPYAKEQVKSAAKASRDHVLDRETEAELERHYDVVGRA